ncbi:hypothetical protein EYR40_010731 [Pleurotus pulmonarius]|nr:hypothetical protein EYR40_010731 [Pleurotus pulmonarius]
MVFGPGNSSTSAHLAKPSGDSALSLSSFDTSVDGNYTPSLPGTDGEGEFDKSTISDLVAKFGSASATAWLEFDRYKIWQSPEDIPPSTFLPVQGYMRRDPHIFAWGNPLVSDTSALEPTAKAFAKWVEEHDLQLIWSCVDEYLERVLGGPSFGWSTVSCIYEDVLDPSHVIDITSSDDGVEKAGGSGTSSHLKDLKKNLRRADKVCVEAFEVSSNSWTEGLRKEVEEGVENWRRSKSGLQLASASLQPWLDEEHRRYWISQHEGKVVGLLILTPIKGNTYQIKNAVSFPEAPKGTSEALIHTALKDLHEEQEARGTTSDRIEERTVVTFGTTASDMLHPVENLAGWKVSALAKTYGKIAKGAGLLRRGDFRNKFDPAHEPMYVCYPEDGFGLEGVKALLKLLKK